MFNCYVVNFQKQEKNKFYLFLKLLGFRWASERAEIKQDFEFPFCIDIERKVVYVTNSNFLKEFESQGRKMISVSSFKKVLEG